jgi:hypothetical protein
MSTFATKFQTGAAACAIAAAATLTPAVVAQADSAAPAPLAPVTQVLDSFALAPVQFAQDNPWWLLPGDPAGFIQEITQVTPIQVIQGFFERAWGWFSTIDATACIGGFGIHIGPYGSISAGRGVGGC